MDDIRQVRIKLEEELLERVNAAKAAYRAAELEHKRLSTLIRDLGPNHPDGVTALAQSVRVGREALDAYRLALREFTDLVVRHVPPRL